MSSESDPAAARADPSGEPWQDDCSFVKLL